MRLHRVPLPPVPPGRLPALYRRIAAEGPHPFWLDSGDAPAPASHARWWAMGAAPARVLAAPPGDVGPVLARLVEDVGPVDRPAPLWVGLLAYEAGAWAEARIPRAPSATPGVPDAWWARYGAVVLGEVGGACEVVGDDEGRVHHLAAVVAEALSPPGGGASPPGEQGGSPLEGGLRAARPDSDVADAVGRVLAWIGAGDVYQVNVTRRFTGRLSAGADAADLFVRLRQLGPVPYAALLDPGPVQVVSLSPECFLRLDLHERRVETCPIKGTRPRGDSPERDAALAAELRADPKELAEHVMIVDLVRNDLGRVCETGSVHVAERWPVVSFPGVHHLVSTVRGTLRRDADLGAVLRATFPCGSITGAPKIRACQIIAEVEREARGVYCGAIGWVDPRGRAVLNVPIRTGVVAGRALHVHAGGGIVADSDPEREIAEGRLKLRTWELAARKA